MQNANPVRAKSPERLQQERICPLVIFGGYGNDAEQPGVSGTDVDLVPISLISASYGLDGADNDIFLSVA